MISDESRQSRTRLGGRRLRADGLAWQDRLVAVNEPHGILVGAVSMSPGCRGAVHPCPASFER